jgi:hypothetical protein
MRSETEVQDRIRYLLTVELDRRVQDAGARLPHKCHHNHRQALDVRKEIDGEPNVQYNRIRPTPELNELGDPLPVRKLPVIGLCMLGVEDPTQWNGTVCEDPIDAMRCPYYNPIETKETVQQGFSQQLNDLDWVATNMPEVSGLLWALGSESLPNLPWWKALWFRFMQIRPDPLVKAIPPTLTSGD